MFPFKRQALELLPLSRARALNRVHLPAACPHACLQPARNQRELGFAPEPGLGRAVTPGWWAPCLPWRAGRDGITTEGAGHHRGRCWVRISTVGAQCLLALRWRTLAPQACHHSAGLGGVGVGWVGIGGVGGPGLLPPKLRCEAAGASSLPSHVRAARGSCLPGNRAVLAVEWVHPAPSATHSADLGGGKRGLRPVARRAVALTAEEDLGVSCP